MKLGVDLASIAHNAARVRALARAAGLDVDVVVKDAFAVQPIVDAVARSGIAHLCLSDRGSVGRLAGDDGRRHQLLGLPVPRDCRAIFGTFASSLHVCAETVEAMAVAADASKASHSIWLGIRTSDGRGGVDLSEASASLSRWKASFRSNLRFGGLLATWGCLGEHPPDRSELDRILDVAHDVGLRLHGEPLPVSIGGSVLLPALGRLSLPPGTRLRVGEAILTGTIPGGGAEALGLHRPFRITAEVCEVRETAGGIETIVNVGRTTCDHEDLRSLGGREAFAWSSSEMSAVRFDRGAHPLVPGDELSFALGFGSAVRAMTRRDVVPRYRNEAGVADRRLRRRRSGTVAATLDCAT